MSEPTQLGFEEGADCKRNGCAGVLEFEPVENCSCHISPPCSACTSADLYCPDCGWRAADDPLCVRDIDRITLTIDGGAGIVEYKRRVLDPTKIDWENRPHSNCSMIKEGVYPSTGDDAADRDAVRRKVDGTFGGKFESFGNGRFKFIAYTD